MDARTLRDHYMGGYCLSSLGAYYNQLKMARHYHSIEQEDLQQHCLDWVDFIQSKSETMFHRYLMVEYLKQGRTPTASEVQNLLSPEAYREWLKTSHDELIGRYEGDELMCYLYLYGYCQGDIYTALVVLIAVVELGLAFEAHNPEQIEASVERIKTIMERWKLFAEGIAELDGLQSFGLGFYKVQSKLHGPIELFLSSEERIGLVLDELKEALTLLEDLQEELSKHLPGIEDIQNQNDNTLSSQAQSDLSISDEDSDSADGDSADDDSSDAHPSDSDSAEE